MVKYRIDVKNEDTQAGAIDSDVCIILLDNFKQTKEHTLTDAFRNASANEKVTTFTIESIVNIPNVQRVEIWMNTATESNMWFLDYLEVTNMETSIKAMLPGKRWISDDRHYFIENTNTHLSQDEPLKDLKDFELKEIQNDLHLELKFPCGAVTTNTPTLDFAPVNKYFIRETYRQAAETIAREVKAKGLQWNSAEDYKECYIEPFPVPSGGSVTFQDDASFGRQRLADGNFYIIKLLTEIPDKFGVTEEMLQSLLEGKTLKQAIENKRMFIIDYEITEGVPTKSPDHVVPAPIALFYFNDSQQLMPVAIQLYQQKGPDNPVFLPTDHESTWYLAKLWFNLVDQICTSVISHFSNHHYATDGFAAVTKRQLASSHPISKLLDPHFFNTLGINSKGLEVVLTSEDAAFEKNLSTGVAGAMVVLTRATANWRLDVTATFPENLKARGIYDDTVLTGAFHVRDDGLLLYDAIKTYVDKYVRLYYGKEGSIANDHQIQAWGAELVEPLDEQGCGYKGIPNNGKFETIDQLVLTLTPLIFTLSASHAVANFSQYDGIGAPFKGTYTLHGVPPKDKSPVTMDTLLKTIPNRLELFSSLGMHVVNRQKFTRSLGDFETTTIVDPPAVQILDEFRKQLFDIGKIIDERNLKREFEYTRLHPRNIPNSISI